MSIEYPCVYFDDGKCRKDPPEDGYVDWCVMGPCSHETPSNADRIRAMSDEELAELILDWVQTGACNDFGVPVTGNCNGKCIECIVEWLKQPAEEEESE